jgi:hypothetical protein
MVRLRLATVFGLALALLAANFLVVINAQAQETFEKEKSPVLLAMRGTQQVTDTTTITDTEETTDTETTEVTGTEETTETVTTTEEVTGTDALTSTDAGQTTAAPQAPVQTLPATGGETPNALPLALVLLGMIFCLSGVLITQMRRES